MAGELLDKMLFAAEKSKNKIRPAEIERGVHHDLESFILVLFYAAMKRGLERGLWSPPAIQCIRQLFRVLFGCHTIQEIAEGRKTFLEIPEYLSITGIYRWNDYFMACGSFLIYEAPRILKVQKGQRLMESFSGVVRDRRSYGQLCKVYGFAIAWLPKACILELVRQSPVR